MTTKYMRNKIAFAVLNMLLWPINLVIILPMFHETAWWKLLLFMALVCVELGIDFLFWRTHFRREQKHEATMAARHPVSHT